ncbi:MAG: hypothetical protein QM755_21460 [Luteolibacter sp.]
MGTREVRFGLFVSQGSVLHDELSGFTIAPSEFPLVYLLPPSNAAKPLLRLANAQGEIVVDIEFSAEAWEREEMEHLKESLFPSPVDATEIRRRSIRMSRKQAA